MMLNKTFSTLHAGRVAATAHETRLISGDGETFSTLHAGRVAATLGILCGLPSTGVFQYPPCGSSRCNTSFSWLSCHHSTFSTLHAGRVAATPGQRE